MSYDWLIYGPLIILAILILLLIFFYIRERVRSSYDLEQGQRALGRQTTEVNRLATAFGTSIIIKSNSTQGSLTRNKSPWSEVPNQNGGGDAKNGNEILPPPTPSAPPISTPTPVSIPISTPTPSTPPISTPTSDPIIRHQILEIPDNIDEVDEDTENTKAKKEVVTVEVAVGDDEEVLPVTPPPLPTTPQPPLPKPRRLFQVVNVQVHNQHDSGAGDANPNEPGCSGDVENVVVPPNENTHPVPKPRKNLSVQ